MSYFNATITPTATGIFDVPCGFMPTGMRITVGAKSNVQTVSHISIGQVDNTGFMTYHSNYADTSGSNSYRGINKMVSHYERISGVVTEVNAAVYNTFYATGAKFQVTLCNSSYQYTVEVWN